MKKTFICRLSDHFSLRALAGAVMLGSLASLNVAFGQTTDIYSSPGTTTWTVPNGVSSITVQSWGAGGGGGGARAGCTSSCSQTATGGGGKGGMFAGTVISVTPGDVLSITVGEGGTGGIGNASAGTAGGASSVTIVSSSTAVVRALGGNGGNSGGLATNGSGATTYNTASGSEVGTTIWNGGNGIAGLKTTSRQSGGGGGGGAGDSGDGISAVNAQTGGGGPLGISAGGAGGNANGGAGGAGGSGTNSGAATAGSAGSVRGGAGGGARGYSSTSQVAANGGAGGRGEVRLTYLTCAANAGAALNYICQNGTSAPLGGSISGQSTSGTWSDGGIGGTFNPAATDLNATWTAPAAYAGMATLTLTTTNGGCPVNGTASKTIAVALAPDAPVFNAGPASICEGGTATYSAAASGVSPVVTYAVLSGGASIDANTGAVSNVTANFTVRATATNNCGSAHADFAVSVNPNPAAPSISAGGPTTFCAGGNVVLASSQATGNVWSSLQTTQMNTVSQSGDYTVTYTDGNGCSAASAPFAVTVHANPQPVITAGGPVAFCEGGSVTLTSSSSTGNLWSTGETANSILVDESVSITVTVTDVNACSGTSPATSVTENPNPVPVITAAGPVTFCEGGSVTIISSSNTGNLWSTGETANSISVDETDAVTVTVTDANGCSGVSNEIEVVEHASTPPVITAAGPTSFCAGGSVTITSSEASGNQWSTGETTNSITVSATMAVTVTNNSGCSSGISNTITVAANPDPAVPVITASGSTTICGNGSVMLSSSATGNVWSTGETTNHITVTSAGTYTVVTTNGNGCSAASLPIVVSVNPFPVALVTLTGDLTITASPSGQTYQWITCPDNDPLAGETSATFTAATNGSYAVIVTNAFGCKDTSSCMIISKVGLDDLAENSGITMYPNPSHGMVTLASDFEQSINLTVFDASGKALLQAEKPSGSVIDLTHFDAGMYIFQIRTSQGISSHRMVIE